MSDPTATRASMIEFDIPTPAPVAPLPTEADALAALGIEGGRRTSGPGPQGQGVATVQAVRAEAAGEYLNVMSNPSPTIKRQLDSAVRRAWEKAPTVAATGAKMAEVVRLEAREVTAHQLRDLRLAPDGWLMDVGRSTGSLPCYRLGEAAYSRLAANAPSAIRGALRYNLNSWIGSAEKRTVNLRTLVQPGQGGRLAFAAVSGKYVAYDIDSAIRDIASALPAESRARVSYGGDGGRWQVEATLCKPFDVEGDMHEMGIVVTSADNGTRGYRLKWCAYRLLCSNGVRIASSSQALRLRHTRDLGDSVRAALDKVGPAMESFSQVWAAAKGKHPVDEKGNPVSARETLERLAEARILKVPGVNRTALAQMLVASYDTEPGDNTAGVINAVTRAAHEWQWSRWADRDDLEEQAGTLLYQHVLRVPAREIELA